MVFFSPSQPRPVSFPTSLAHNFCSFFKESHLFLNCLYSYLKFVAGKERAEVAFAGSVEAREEERLGEEEVRWLGMALERGEAMEGAARTC